MTLAAAFVFGLLVGSFLNVCIHRWPNGQSVVRPRSRCLACGQPIGWHDNIPVASFVWLKGRCRNCGRAISVRYPIVELANAAAYGLIVAQFGLGAAAWKYAILASMLLILFWTDLACFVLPDQVTLPGIAVGIGFSPFLPLREGIADIGYLLAGHAPPPWLVSLTEAALGAALFGGGLFLVGEIFYRARGIEGLGFGDVKLAAMIAAFQGTSATLLILLAGCLLALGGGLLAILAQGRGWRAPLPLGSYLAGAALASVFAGDAILNRYWEFMLE